MSSGLLREMVNVENEEQASRRRSLRKLNLRQTHGRAYISARGRVILPKLATRFLGHVTVYMSCLWAPNAVVVIAYQLVALCSTGAIVSRRVNCKMRTNELLMLTWVVSDGYCCAQSLVSTMLSTPLAQRPRRLTYHKEPGNGMRPK